MARQGDILIIPVNSIPEGAQPIERCNGRIVLAEGEVTGHAHVILDEGVELLAVSDQADRWLRLRTAEPVHVRHEEHGTVAVTERYNVVRSQMEYQPDAIRQIAD